MTVASGLDNPRLLSFSHHSLYVAEAGRGGAGPCVPGPEEEDVCFGLSGALGPSDVVPFSRHRFAATIGLGLEREVRETFGEAGASLGTVVIGRLYIGKPRVAADLAAYEAEEDPDGNGPDSDPTGMLLERWSAVVTDAGGNTLLRVLPGGRIEAMAVFPNRLVPAPGPPPQAMVPMQAVPTSVVLGDDGAYTSAS